nr:hypothetical protein [Azohydromonas australica]
MNLSSNSKAISDRNAEGLTPYRIRFFLLQDGWQPAFEAIRWRVVLFFRFSMWVKMAGAEESYWLRDAGLDVLVRVDPSAEEEYLQHQKGDAIELHEARAENPIGTDGTCLKSAKKRDFGVS